MSAAFDAEGFEALGGAAGGERLDGDGVAGVDGQDWLCLGGVVAPGHGGGGGEQGLLGGKCCRGKRNAKSEQRLT